MSPASSGNIEVERYIGACLISSQTRHKGAKRDQYQNYPNIQAQRCPNNPDRWAGGVPLISFANQRWRRADPAKTTPHRGDDQKGPLSRLVVHAQGAPLILTSRYSNRSKGKNAKKGESVDKPSADTASVASDESSGSGNAETCLPRIIKPRKRRKKDRKPPHLNRPLSQDGSFSTDSASPEIDSTPHSPLVAYHPNFNPYDNAFPMARNAEGYGGLPANYALGRSNSQIINLQHLQKMSQQLQNNLTYPHPNNPHQNLHQTNSLQGSQQNLPQTNSHQNLHRTNSHQNHLHQNQSHPNQSHQNQSHQNQSHQNQSHQNQSLQNQSHQNQSHQNQSHQNNSHQNHQSNRHETNSYHISTDQTNSLQNPHQSKLHESSLHQPNAPQTNPKQNQPNQAKLHGTVHQKTPHRTNQNHELNQNPQDLNRQLFYARQGDKNSTPSALGEISETPKLHHAFEDVEELEEVNGNASSCQCRYCDPSGQIWDIDRSCYSPYLTGPFQSYKKSGLDRATSSLINAISSFNLEDEHIEGSSRSSRDLSSSPKSRDSGLGFLSDGTSPFGSPRNPFSFDSTFYHPSRKSSKDYNANDFDGIIESSRDFRAPGDFVSKNFDISRDFEASKDFEASNAFEVFRDFETMRDFDALEPLKEFKALKDLGALKDLEALKNLGALKDLEALKSLGALKNLEALKGFKALKNLEALKDVKALRDLEAVKDFEVFATPNDFDAFKDFDPSKDVEVPRDLEVSTEIVTSLNGHRDLEIKFFSLATPFSDFTSEFSLFSNPDNFARKNSELCCVNSNNFLVCEE